jgi:uncharacterized protein YacL
MANLVTRGLFIAAGAIMGAIWVNYVISQTGGQEPLASPMMLAGAVIAGAAVGIGVAVGVLALLRVIAKEPFEQRSPAILITRGLFMVACAIMGALWGNYLLAQASAPEQLTSPWRLAGALIGGALIGLAVAAGILFVLRFITQELFERLSPAILAIVLALVAGFVLGEFIFDLYFPNADVLLRTFAMCSIILLFAFVGIQLGLTRASNWESLILAVHRHQYDGAASAKIVDTSVIIDGRISDIVETGFIEGTLLVPRFVLRELQNIADSSDELRRARGRRGLDILRSLQDPGSKVTVEVIEDDPQEVHEVDGKLVRVANERSSKILTNDLNLNKVAQIEGVEVLNINDLANALKPAVLPDEPMRVRIVKQGKEAMQGVGYLDDGTMVVVDGGRDHLGQEVEVLVTSVLQTSAGRMIFSKLQTVLA